MNDKDIALTHFDAAIVVDSVLFFNHQYPEFALSTNILIV